MSAATPKVLPIHKEVGHEQRRATRTVHRRTFVIHVMHDGVIGQGVPTRAHDFSSIGIGLIHAGRLAKGERFVVPLATQAGPPILLLYSVVHCRPLGNGLFGVGAELLSLMDAGDFVGKYPTDQTFSEYLKVAMAK